MHTALCKFSPTSWTFWAKNRYAASGNVHTTPVFCIFFALAARMGQPNGCRIFPPSIDLLKCPLNLADSPTEMYRLLTWVSKTAVFADTQKLAKESRQTVSSKEFSSLIILHAKKFWQAALVHCWSAQKNGRPTAGCLPVYMYVHAQSRCISNTVMTCLI